MRFEGGGGTIDPAGWGGAVFKSLVRTLTTCGLLVAAYLGYVRAFAVVVDRVGAPAGIPVLLESLEGSESVLEARRLAILANGPGHWSQNALITHVDRKQGFYIYANDYDFDDDYRVVVLKPLLVIWRNRDGRAIKTLSAEEAELVFSKPLGFARPSDEDDGGGDAHVISAIVKRDIRIRDDKGTPGELGDDMTIVVPNYVAFSERENLISTDDRVEIRERDTLATASEGAEIRLLPKPAAAEGLAPGYNGARSIQLLGSIRVFAQDVGRTGVVPGGMILQQAPEAIGADPDAPAAKPAEPRPGEIVCDDGLLIELPPPAPTVRVGPPERPGPTLAHFRRNVHVRQGDAQDPERLDCDLLDLVLVPAGPGNRTTDNGDGGPVSELSLKRAKATGSTVRAESRLQGLIAVGNELIYERNGPARPDVTYLHGTRQVDVSKRYEDGTIDLFRSRELTIHHQGTTSAVASVVAGGPGWMQTRSADGREITRSASWTTGAVLRPVADDPTRRQLTIEGSPRVDDPKQGNLAASQVIIATLVAKPPKLPSASAATGKTDEAVEPVVYATGEEAVAAAKAEAKDPAGPLSGGAYRIELMRAYRDVTLVSKALPAVPPEPSGAKAAAPDAPAGDESVRTLRSREMLVVHFEYPTTAEPVVETGPTPPPAPRPVPGAVAGTASISNDAEDIAVAKSVPEPPDPPIDVMADHVWAWVILQEGGTKGEVREARLRGGVAIRQARAPDGSRGFEAIGERVDLIGVGERLFRVYAYAEPGKLARVATPAFAIQGGVLGFDQEANYAVAVGPGHLIQRDTGANLLGESRPVAIVADGRRVEPPKPSKPKGPLTITWGWDDKNRPRVDEAGRPIEAWMKFYGITADESGAPAPAQAEFRGGVRAWTDDSMLTSDRLIADFDGPVDFQKARINTSAVDLKAKPDSDPADTSPMPQVADVTAEGKVRAIVRKVDERGRLVEQQRVEGEVVHFDKATNSFDVESPGVACLYTRQKSGQAGFFGKPPAPGPVAGSGARVRQVADRRNAADSDLGPLALTRIQFEDRMVGQINARPNAEGGPAAPRTGLAEFFGNVRVMHAGIDDPARTVDPDRPPPDFVYSVSKKLRVISEPPPPGAPESAANRVLLQAWDDVFASVGRSSAKVASQVTSIHADDRMNYDSATGLMVFYGGEGGVTIADQSGAGQQYSSGGGDVVSFNQATGGYNVLGARQIQFVDAQTGSRAAAPPANPPKKPDAKKKRTPFPRVGPSDKERRNFNGR